MDQGCHWQLPRTTLASTVQLLAIWWPNWKMKLTIAAAGASAVLPAAAAAASGADALSFLLQFDKPYCIPLLKLNSLLFQHLLTAIVHPQHTTLTLM
jgi:hypothetical protein